MATPKWHLSGDFYGNCSCAHLRCPCPTSYFTELPTMGWCKLAIVFYAERGQFGDVNLDGHAVIMVADIPGAMAEGGWTIGLIFDDKIAQDQLEALAAIMGGQVGGPMEDAAPWVSNFLGVEKQPILYRKEGLNRWLTVPGMIDIHAAGVPGANPNEPVYWDNVYHPANTRVALGRGVKTSIHAFGIDFEGEEGQTMGAIATFNWQVG